LRSSSLLRGFTCRLAPWVHDAKAGCAVIEQVRPVADGHIYAPGLDWLELPGGCRAPSGLASSEGAVRLFVVAAWTLGLHG
jgi:hypothetical protein